MSVLMIGFTVDEAYFDRHARRDRLPQVAARKLEMGFIDGLREHGKCGGVMGFFAASTYPGNPTVFFPGLGWRFRNAVRAWVLPFVNAPLLKLPSRAVVLAGAFVIWICRFGRPAAVCIYSAHTPYLVVAYLFRRLLGIPYFVIIPDLPRFMDVVIRRSALRRVAKRLDSVLIEYLVSKSSGIVAITEAIITDVPAWQTVPAVVIEGMQAPDVELHGAASGVEPGPGPSQVGPKGAMPSDGGARPYFVYSGGLSEAYGVAALVEAFMSTALNAELWLCGAGELTEFVETSARKDPRIRYLGFLSQDQLRNIQRGATALLLTRSPTDPYVKYSFPSKLLEYMSSGVPVLATQLPGIPDEYMQYLTALADARTETIAAALQAHLCRDDGERAAQGRRAKQFVAEQKNPRVAVRPLLELMVKCDV